MIWSSVYEFLVLASIVITFTFGLALLLIKFPVSKELQSYRIFRIVMACTYLSLCAVNIIEIFTRSEVVDIQLIRCLVLPASSIQAFLCTYSYIALINPAFITGKKILKNSIHVLIISFASGLIYNIPTLNHYFDTAFFLMTVYYTMLLIHYTLLFRKTYKEYLFKVDNYYSEMESVRMKWVLVSFIASLFLGIFALLSVVFTSLVIAILLNLYMCIFYTFYGIRFISYGFLFQYVQPVLDEDSRNEEIATTPEPADKDIPELKIPVGTWIEQEQYLQPNITIEQVAKHLNTNRTYLSAYINKTEGKTFREWINHLRINKAKQLLLAHPDLSVTEIATITGYNDCSNLNKQFVKHTGTPAGTWRAQNPNKL